MTARGTKLGMLRPPPGSQDKDEAPPPRKRLLTVAFAVLFLVAGMIICFVGALVIRNPELPNYLLDRIVTQFQGKAGNGPIASDSGNATPFPSATPPPPPQTAEEYLALMSYDPNVLSTNERAIVEILNRMVQQVMVGGPPVEVIAQQIVPNLQSFKPGQDFTEIRTAVQICRDGTNAAVRRCQDASAQLADKLIAAGIEAPMAHQTADAFGRRALTDGHLYWPDEVIKVCDSVTTLVDLLSKNPSKWKLDGDKRLLFANQAMIDKFRSGEQDLNAALTAINERYKAQGK